METVLIVGAIIVVLVLMILPRINFTVEGEDSEEAINQEKENLKNIKMPTKKDIKALKTVEDLHQKDQEMQNLRDRIFNLSQRIEDFYMQERSTKQLDNKVEKLDDLSRYIEDRIVEVEEANEPDPFADE